VEAALIGLAGIIVGALLAGVVDLLKTLRRERKLATGVARVLELELIELDSLIRWSLEDQVVRLSPSDVERLTDVWLEHRMLLATKLVVPGAWMNLARTFQAAKVWADRNGDRLDDEDRQYLGRWLERIKRAQAVLSTWPKGRLSKLRRRHQTSLGG
jgi:hypothetical protein